MLLLETDSASNDVGGCIVVDAPSASTELADIGLAKRIAEILDDRYPKHAWGVSVNSAQGVGFIFNLRCSASLGWVMHLSDLDNHHDLVREAMRGGGEILERFRLSRGEFKPDEYAILLTTLRGECIADVG